MMQQYCISEIAQLTGINSVTLRAWQRRYGLLNPQRTDKGHRVYTQQDLEQILQIQQWLARGVAIGKVKALLNPSSDVTLDAIDTPYEQEIAQLNQAIAQLKIHRWQSLINQYLADYPATLVCQQILQSVITQWQSCAENTAARVNSAVFLHNVQQILALRHVQFQQNARSKPLWFVPISPCQPLQQLLWALPLSQQGFRLMESQSILSVTELAIALETSPSPFMLCYGEHRLEELQSMLRLQQIAQQHQCQLFLLGPVWSIHQSLWQQQGFQGAAHSGALQSQLQSAFQSNSAKGDQ